MLSEREANEGRSTFLIEILYRNFQSRGVACCFILSSFFDNETALDFQKFFVENIQKIKNGLRIICCAPHHRRYAAEPPPKGKPRSAAFKWFVSENKRRPSSPCFARSFPPRGSQVNKAINIAFSPGEKVLSECEANEGRSLLFYTFKFFDNETAPHHRRYAAEPPPKGKPRSG